MVGMLERVTARHASLAPARSITTLDDYAQAVAEFMWNGLGYPLTGLGPQQTQTGEPAETITNSLEGYAQAAYAANGIVFACMAVRMLVFSGIQFIYQRWNQGQPSDLFSTPDLELLKTPWVGGTTQDLLVRTIQDADLAGNYYATAFTPLPRLGGDGGGRELVRLRPDWVQIVLEARAFRGATLGYRKVGLLYYEGGIHSGAEAVPLLPSEVVHFAPYPDPLATYRGMSWLTPVIREVQADGLMNRHKRRFFEHAATPNLIIKHPVGVKASAIKRFKIELETGHAGVDQAYKNLYVGDGADVTVVGRDMQQMDFKTVQGAGETRIAAAAGVPPVVVGLSEGLQGSSLNAGNYGQARRRLADGTMHPLWGNAAGSFGVLVPPPAGARLWYSSRHVPFLREDEKDQAEIAFMQAQTMRQLVDAGYTPQSVQQAVTSGDYSVLVHSGLYSVQLQAPGTGKLDDVEVARNLVEMVQKVYLGVGVVLTADEARELINRAGGNLPVPGPLAAAPAAAPSLNGSS